MKKIILIIFLFSTFSLYSIDSKIEFKKANDFFNNGDYNSAAEIYNNLLENGFKENEIYYNLGNTYFRLEKIPLAILNYERAKKLNPSDEDINFNLKIAYLRIVDKFEPVPKLFFIEWYEQIVRLFYSGDWGILLVVSVWIFFISLVLVFFSSNSSLRRTVALTTFISLFLIMISSFLGYKSYVYENEKNEAIIFNPSVYVKSAPDPGSTDLFILHEGTKVIINESIDNWLQIRVENGDIGWIKNDEIEII